MAKRKRIPELVVGKIYIDDGRGTNVYTLDVDNDNDGALRIGDNRNGAVATINQNTGEISATRIRGSSLHGDGSEIEGITQQQQDEIDSAKLVTVTSDRLFFVFQEAGAKGLMPYDPAETVTIKAKLNNVDEDVVWSSDEPTLNYSTNGDTLTFTANDMKAFDSVTITATVDNLYDSITIGKVINGATGKSAVTILMPNDTVNFQAAADGTVADLSAGESDIIVMYGSDRLTPSIKDLRRGEFKVSLASSKHDENITCGSIVPDANIKKFTVGPAGKGSHRDMTADSASITYTIEVYTQDGDQHTFEKVQSFTKSKDGWDGSAGKTLKLSADDYQIAYDQHGLAPTPSVINVEAEPGGTSESLKYKFYLNNVAVTDWQDSNTHQFASPAQHENFDKMFIKVEATTNETESPVEVYAHDSISIIGTKEGENVVRISSDNPSHSFTVDAAGGILPADYDVGAINFNLYFGNAELAPNTAATFDPEADEASLLASFTNLGINQFAVNAEPSDSTLDLDDPGRNVNGQTISCSPSVNGNILKYTPSNFGSGETAAAIVFTFYARVTAETIMGPYTVTQTFSKSREGQQGEQGPVGPGGASAKATKLSADDYQVAYNAAGKNPDPTIVTLTATNQNMLEVQNIEYRFTEDGNTTGMQTSNTYVLDVEDISYSDFNKKKNIKVEVFEGGVFQAEDSVSIIATKEGSNAVEIVGDNLSHQFTADSVGGLDDPESGNNSFEVYIGNTQLTPVQDRTEAAWTDANAKNVFTAEATYTGVSGVSNNPFTVEDVNGQPLRLQHSLKNASMPGDFGSIEFTIYVKDSDGEDRGPYKKKQTLTVSKEALNAKSVMLTADSYVFPFDETSSTVPRTGEGVITATMKLENVGDKWAKAPVVKVYATGELNALKMKNMTITGTTDANGTGELQFQIDYDELKAEAKGDTGKVKGWLPLRVQASVGNGTYSDTMNIWALDGGSNSVQAIIPNNNHGFVSEEDGTVLPEYLGVGGSGVTVFEAGVPIDFDKDLAWEDGNGDAIFLNTDEVGNPTWNFKKTADISDGVVRYTSKNNMVVVSIDNTNGNIVVDSVDKDVDNDTIDVEIFVRRSTGEGVTLPMTLSYNKAKKGQKGKDVKNVNGDFSEGPVGWSAMEGDAEFTNAGLTPEDLLDLGADLFRVAPHDDAEHGENVGIFKPYSNPSVGFGAPDYFWNSKSVAIGRGGRWDFDLRARTGGVGSVAPGHKMRWWIRLYKTNAVDPTSPDYVDGAAITYTIKDIAIRNKDMRDNPSQAHPNPYVVVDSWTPAGQALSVDGSTLEEAALTNTEFNDHKISFTPSQFQEILPGASSFRVGIEFIPAGTDVVELIVDCCKATYSMFGSIVDLDPVWKAGVETTTEDLQDRWGHLVDEVADADAQTLYNGKMRILDSGGKPDGILFVKNGNVTRDDPRFLVSNSGVTIVSQDGASGDNKRRALWFRAVRIPSEDHRMKIKATYHRTDDDDGVLPKMYVYFLDDEIENGKKYVGSSSDTWKYSPASDGTAGADLVDKAGTESADNIYFSKELTAQGSESTPAVVDEIITFGDGTDVQRGTGKPKWASIAFFGGGGGNTSDLTINEVSLEWDFGSGAILERSIAGMLASPLFTSVSSSVVQNALDSNDLADRFSHLVDDSADANPESLFNGSLSILSPADNYPEGIVLTRKDDSSSTVPVRDTSSKVFIGAVPGYVTVQNDTKQRGFWFKAVKVPSTEHDMRITVTYYRNNSNSSGNPTLYVYFYENDLPAGKKYVVSRTTAFRVSDGDECFERDSANLYAGGFNLDNTSGTEASPVTETFTVTFDTDATPTTDFKKISENKEAKWASIAIFGSNKSGTDELNIKEVTLDWQVKSTFLEGVREYNSKFKGKTSEDLAALAGVSSFHGETSATLSTTVANNLTTNTTFLNAIAGNIDEDGAVANPGGGGYGGGDYQWGNFTGKHPCLLSSATAEDLDDLVGKIVVSTGEYRNESAPVSNAPTIDESLPIVKVSLNAQDKAAFGVIARYFKSRKDIYEINSLGEGGMWVSDASGFLENGDYICSSNIPGYGMKQDDDILRNYTVAKITQDCYFDLESEDYECKEVEHDGETFKVAFVGCTYHCG